MSPLYDIGIFGGDMRQVYMAAFFAAKGFKVAAYNLAETESVSTGRPAASVSAGRNYGRAQSLDELFDNSRVIIGPVPMSRDQISIYSVNPPADLTVSHIAYLLRDHHILIGGNIPAPLIQHCNSRNIITYDLMKDEKVAILNAVATAEGTIMEAIRSSSINLHGSRCLVLGYGRCAKILAQKLKALDAAVTVAARNPEALAYAYAAGFDTIPVQTVRSVLASFQFVFNTIPAFILDKSCLELIDREAVIIDISSAPGGLDFDYARALGLNASLAPGLPGKVAPKASSDILAGEIISFLKERSD